MTHEQAQVGARVKRWVNKAPRIPDHKAGYRYGVITRVNQAEWGATLITVKRDDRKVAETWACDFWDLSEMETGV